MTDRASVWAEEIGTVSSDLCIGQRLQKPSGRTLDEILLCFHLIAPKFMTFVRGNTIESNDIDLMEVKQIEMAEDAERCFFGNGYRKTNAKVILSSYGCTEGELPAIGVKRYPRLNFHLFTPNFMTLNRGNITMATVAGMTDKTSVLADETGMDLIRIAYRATQWNRGFAAMEVARND
jgi:hypothetical protein